MAYTKVVLTEEVLYLQDKTYNANSDRKFMEEIISQGVLGTSAGSQFQVTLSSGLTLNVAAGHAVIDGQNVTDQGMYRVRSLSAQSIAVGAGDPTNPRLDQIILRVLDNAVDASGSSEARIEVIPGTPTAGTTLANRNGATNLTTLTEASKSVLLIADVLVPAGAASIVAGNIADKRTFATLGNNINIDASKIVGFLPGPQTIQGILTVSNQVVYSGVISPTGFSGTVNDWAPTGLANVETIRATALAAKSRLTGLTGGVNGRQITLQNVSNNSIILSSEDTLSAPGNRFSLLVDYELMPANSVILRYDGFTTRWKVNIPSPARILQDCYAGTISDQSALVITPTQQYGMMLFYARNLGVNYQDLGGLISYRCGVNAFCTKLLSPNAITDVSTAVLTGTTGTAGHFTISSNTNGNLYIENRVGGARSIGYMLLGI